MMADLPTKLKDYLGASQTHILANIMPLGIVAGASGLIIGAAIATPAFAAAGLGLVLTSVAANIASSLVYDVMKPDLDDGDRARTIAQGLKARDPGVIRLVAEALAGAGPDVARAIPAATRAELIDALKLGMQEPGGALAAIAPSYTFNGHNLRYCHAERSEASLHSKGRFFASLRMTDTARWQYPSAR